MERYLKVKVENQKQPNKVVPFRPRSGLDNKRSKTISIAPPGYHTIELNERVPGIEPEIFRWKWRANRRCRKLNAARLVDTYRHEVHDWLNGRWGVVAMQNQAVKNEQ